MTRVGGLARNALPLACAVLLVTSLLPATVNGAAQGLGAVFTPMLTPVSHPLSMLKNFLRKGPQAPAGPGDELRLLLEYWKTQAYRRADEVRDLKERLAELDVAYADAEQTLSIANAPVVGEPQGPGGLVRARFDLPAAEQFSEVVASIGSQLVGRVVEAERGHVLVRLLTDPRTGPVTARIVLTDAGDGLSASLTPDGPTLRGPAQAPPAGSSLRPPQVGDEVRLDDSSWPELARGLLLGRVSRVERAENDRVRVTVTPAERLDQLARFQLRMPRTGRPPSDRAQPDRADGLGRVVGGGGGP